MNHLFGVPFIHSQSRRLNQEEPWIQNLSNGPLIPKGPKAIFRPFLKFGHAIVKAIFIKNS
jgi:hypothetical protein